MSPDLDRKLCEDFPNLYRDRNAGPGESLMCFGFPGDGWEPLIRRLSEKIEAIIVALPEDRRRHYRASQVKEKFGTLRFSMAATTAEIEAAIDEAEAGSAETCETCGAPGSERETAGGWIHTACEAHVRR